MVIYLLKRQELSQIDGLYLSKSDFGAFKIFIPAGSPASNLLYLRFVLIFLTFKMIHDVSLRQNH